MSFHTFTCFYKIELGFGKEGQPTYKSLFCVVSKSCSQKTGLRWGRTLRAEVDKVLGRHPPAANPAPRDGELIPPPPLFNPPVEAMSSDRPPLDPDILNLEVLSNKLSSWHPPWRASNVSAGSTRSTENSSRTLTNHP